MRSASGRLELGQSRPQLVWFETVDFYGFVATSRAADDAHLPRPQAKCFSDQLLDRRVRPPFDGSGTHPNAQHAVDVRDTLNPGIGMRFDAQPQHHNASVAPGRRGRLWVMSVGLQRRAVVRNVELTQVLQLVTALLLIWLGALELQEHSAPGQLTWAALDVLVHGSTAGLCAVWLLPGFGWRPFIAAIAAGVFIDLDHAVAARSLDPLKMMSLAARPPTHSLLAAVLVGIVAGRLLGRVCGYAVGIGIVAHLLGDAIEPAGVPLLVPFVANPRLQVSVSVLIGGMLVMALASAWLSQRANRRPHSSPL
jgi:hypothetical protein